MLDQKKTKGLIRDLVTGSRKTLDSALLTRLDLNSHLQREIKAQLGQAIENLGWAHFVELLRDYGEEIVGQLTPPRAALPISNAQPEGTPECICGHKKRPSHPVCFRCFARLPTSLKYDLADRDPGKRLPALAEAANLLRRLIARQREVRSLFGD